MSNETLLVISGQGVSPYSARGLTQTLTPIDAAVQLRRTLNGDLLDLSAAQFRKYKSTISCTDHDAPAFDGVWPGQLVTVDCVAELSYKTAGGAALRPVVPDSLRTNGDYTFYRPRLQMRVATTSMNADEWAASTQWSIDLEEE